MPEVIEFVKDWFAEVESDPGRLKQVAFRRGARLKAEVILVNGGEEDILAADLRLADGTTARHVPLSRIAVVGDSVRAV